MYTVVGYIKNTVRVTVSKILKWFIYTSQKIVSIRFINFFNLSKLLIATKKTYPRGDKVNLKIMPIFLRILYNTAN